MHVARSRAATLTSITKVNNRYIITAFTYVILVFLVATLFIGLLQFGPSLTVNRNLSWMCGQEQIRLFEWEARLLRTERELKRMYSGFTESIVRGRFTSADDLPIIYVVTPTYARPVQKAELTRLSQTLLHVPALRWIVVEDAEKRSQLVSRLLQRSGLVYTHLAVPTPQKFKHAPKEHWFRKPRGVLQRNMALQWLRGHLNSVDKGNGLKPSGVLYFADDDNVYDLALFDEMRYTKTVSIWPVGLACALRYESPLLNETTGLVTGWITSPMCQNRLFATDMAGFAVNTRLLLENPNATFNISAKLGQHETEFLRQMISELSLLEPKANNCSEVLVWHTKTEQPDLKNEPKLNRTGQRVIEEI